MNKGRSVLRQILDVVHNETFTRVVKKVNLRLSSKKYIQSIEIIIRHLCKWMGSLEEKSHRET